MWPFNKKEEVPEIPPMPALPDFPKHPAKKTEKPAEKTPEMTTFHKEEVIMDMPEDMEIYDEKESLNLPELPKKPEFEISEMPSRKELEETLGKSKLPEIQEKPVRDFEPKLPEISGKPIQQIPEKPVRDFEPKHFPKFSDENEPFFIRFDKFQEAQKDFKEINKKVKTIEKVLQKINQTKLKEDAEVEAWTQNLEKIKQRLSEIDSNIFNKI